MVTNCSLSKPQLCNPRIQYFLMNKLLNSLKISQYCAELDRDGSIKQFLERASAQSPQLETKPNQMHKINKIMLVATGGRSRTP